MTKIVSELWDCGLAKSVVPSMDHFPQRVIPCVNCYNFVRETHTLQTESKSLVLCLPKQLNRYLSSPRENSVMMSTSKSIISVPKGRKPYSVVIWRKENRLQASILLSKPMFPMFVQRNHFYDISNFRSE